MELKVNDQHVDITLEGESTIGEVLKAFEEEASKNGATTIGIKINGEIIPPENFDSVIKQTIQENTLIELSVISSLEVTQMIKDTGNKFKETIPCLQEISAMLQSGKDKEAYDTIGKFADQIDSFCHSVTLSALFPEVYAKLTVDGQDMSKFFEEFAPLLKDFEEAFQNKDTVTIGDLAEYEISPRLESISEAIETAFN